MLHFISFLILLASRSEAHTTFFCEETVALTLGQKRVQATNNKTRKLYDLDFLAFATGSPATEYISKLVDDKRPPKGFGLLLDLLKAKKKNKAGVLRWTEMGGGLGIAQREAKVALGEDLECTNVDLVNWEQGGAEKELRDLRSRNPTMSAAAALKLRTRATGAIQTRHRRNRTCATGAKRRARYRRPPPKAKAHLSHRLAQL